jgi:hypothetical protein
MIVQFLQNFVVGKICRLYNVKIFIRPCIQVRTCRYNANTGIGNQNNFQIKSKKFQTAENKPPLPASKSSPFEEFLNPPMHIITV